MDNKMHKIYATLLASLLFYGCSDKQDNHIVRINPKGVFDTTKFGFPQVLITEGRKFLFTNAVAMDTNMNIIGENDLAAQMDQALGNLKILLAAGGGTPGHIAQMRVNVVNLQDHSRHIVIEKLNAFYGDYPRASNALIGVERLARPDLLVEIEIIAALD